MNKAKFTVVIPSYNRAAYISKAIESIFKQTNKRWKLLIVDDASSDDTIKRVQPYLEDERVRLIVLPENQGISGVMNVALREIDTPYFIQLDSDDWLPKNTLKLINRAIKKNPRAGLYYGNIKMWSERKNGGWKVVKHIRHRPFQSRYQFLTYMTYMLHPRCYRTSAVKKVGGWDTSDAYGGRIMEDRRMVVKVLEKYPIYWINEVLYHRRKHRNQLTHPKDYQARNQLRRELVLTSLKKWGNRYKPIFGKRNGLLIVRSLISKK